ncbi:transcriptional regulator NrdR [bacterium]|jgi:transcriptional repressor NrdR|nr:transcriptional regulator NrdR [bacterium]MCI0615225.1 transcriptional regulator NrdR [bacterium]
MKCPYCGSKQNRVIDSRESKGGESIRRRRECEDCKKRFTSYERVEEILYMVVKKDGRRERYDRGKILGGLLRAAEKRPVPITELETVADEIEGMLSERSEKEISTTEVGGYIMESLKRLDKVAYVRFASVYREFKDVGEFIDEVKSLMNER